MMFKLRMGFQQVSEQTLELLSFLELNYGRSSDLDSLLSPSSSHVFGHDMVTAKYMRLKRIYSWNETVHICSESTKRWQSKRIIGLDAKDVLLSVTPHVDHIGP